MLIYFFILPLLFFGWKNYFLLTKINYNTSSQILIASFKETYLKTGLPIIYIKLSDNKEYAFIVDTGANANVISKEVLTQLCPNSFKLKESVSISHINGVKQDLSETNIIFHINKHKFKETFIITEFTEAYRVINKKGDIEIAGILGSKFLNKYKLKVLFADYTLNK